MTTPSTSTGSTAATIGNVHYPVADVSAAVSFYETAFSIRRLFVDGDRYAALDAGGVKLALAGDSEKLVEVPSASFKVSDLDQTLDLIAAGGGTTVLGPVDGPHERRAVARDPWGNFFIVYEPN
ncbi:VOC family protein [Rhodococcus fascians]|nr:VOC family protein [Rhodococcus fascians]MBY3999949.1 VOC family protein [Rhodococcus fascians]MBY4005132.1 VOC family protein [Rhodococcus fascians]MBY4010309.1 VOC family protein [Rhodococcus fascians]MBY4020352.1 VOC family protein [Rhodococcus fascians]